MNDAVSILWITFIVLKVAHIIHWSWWLVIFWPLIPLAIFMFLAVTLGSGWALWQECKLADKLFQARTNY